MKKVLFILLFALFGVLTTNAQTVVQQDWRGEQVKEWDSFYWSVARSTYPDKFGRYWYYIYFFSNSLLNQDKNEDGSLDRAITYIDGVGITMYEYSSTGVLFNKFLVSLDHVTCDYVHNKNVYHAYFYSNTPHAKFTITYNRVSAWAESEY